MPEDQEISAWKYKDQPQKLEYLFEVRGDRRPPSASRCDASSKSIAEYFNLGGVAQVSRWYSRVKIGENQQQLRQTADFPEEKIGARHNYQLVDGRFCKRSPKIGLLVELSGFDKSDRQIDAFSKSFRHDPFDVFSAKCEADFERQLKQVPTEDMGQIRMLPGMAADGRLKIDEVGYSLRRRENAVDAPVSGAGLRVGLSRLLVEWKWGEEDQARLCEECHTVQGRIGHLANANPELDISPAERDVARLRIGTKPKDAGTWFPPRPDLAIASFVFPEARLADCSQHAFSIHAAKQDLCLGQWNPDTQLFEEVTIDGQRLREAYETTRHAAELALAEVQGEFPSDGGWKCLGTRIAQVVEEPAIEQKLGSR